MISEIDQNQQQLPTKMHLKMKQFLTSIVLILGPQQAITEHFIQTARKKRERPNTQQDSSDFDENLTDRIATMRTIISQIFRAVRADFRWFQRFIFAKFRQKTV